MLRIHSLLLVLATLLVCTPAAAAAQSPLRSELGGSVRSRAELERLLQEYDVALASPAYSEAVKRGIRADAELIRARLRDGDFRVGDRITLDVQGEPTLPDTVVVESGPMIVLPLFGEIPLGGVLRSEIQAHLTQAFARFIREPVVRANGHIRMSVQGQIARPGFFTMPAEILVSDALMVAGGPTPASNMDAIRIERGPAVLLEGEDLQEAIRNGLTLDQLNLQAGDQIVVPERRTGEFLGTVGLVAGIIGSLSFLVFQLTN